jgi:hypothetical protein
MLVRNPLDLINGDEITAPVVDTGGVGRLVPGHLQDDFEFGPCSQRAAPVSCM